MPKTKLQDVVFTILMVIVMVYAMVVYNVCWDQGSSINAFRLALYELPVMCPIAFILEFFFVGNLSKIIVFKHMTPQDKPILITFFISGVTVAFMCPMMSFFASLIFGGANINNFFSVFLPLFARNLPMAFFWQFMYAGPFVRLIFVKLIQPLMEAKKDKAT